MSFIGKAIGSLFGGGSQAAPQQQDQTAAQREAQRLADESAAKRVAEEAAKKAAGRSAINRLFGYGPKIEATRNPRYENVTRTIAGRPASETRTPGVATVGAAAPAVEPVYETQGPAAELARMLAGAEPQEYEAGATSPRRRRAAREGEEYEGGARSPTGRRFGDTEGGDEPFFNQPDVVTYDPGTPDQTVTEQVISGYDETPGYDPGDARRQREAQIAEIMKTNLDLNKTALGEQRSEAARRLKFGLANAGLRGGSADVYAADKVQRTHADRIRDAIAGADEIGANVRTADEEARLRLLGQVEAGADENALLAGAGDTLRSNVDRANAQARGNIIQGAFQDIGTGFGRAEDRRAVANAKTRAEQLRGPGSTASSYQGT